MENHPGGGRPAGKCSDSSLTVKHWSCTHNYNTTLRQRTVTHALNCWFCRTVSSWTLHSWPAHYCNANAYDIRALNTCDYDDLQLACNLQSLAAILK